MQNISFEGSPIEIYGERNYVNYGANIDVQVLKRNSYANELIIAHNHPSTQSFSFADIAVFLLDEYIGVSTVVTNQGQIYCLRKQERFDYNKARQLLYRVYDRHALEDDPVDAGCQAMAAKEFLRQAEKVGVWYEKGNAAKS